MCGIAGVLRFDDRSVANQDLEPMIGALSHRGPDGAGAYAQGPFGLAMTRLAIIDVAGGQQPIFNEDKTIAIVCNGEIYNYQRLREQLEERGHQFRTHSDVEVILHLYEDHGPNCFRLLNGMFGAAIADFRQRRLVLARDHFGQKPLYIWRTEKQLAFASELKALTALDGFPRRLSYAGLAGYLNFRYVPAPLTIWEDCEKLQPGSYMTVDERGKTEVNRYWSINLSPTGKRDRTTSTEEILEQFTAGVERHLMSERPLGVFLSGGVDSGAIVAGMSLAGHRHIQTYTVGFEGFEENEFANARSIAEKYRTVHEEVTLTADGFLDTLNDVVYSTDEPLADLTTVPLYYLSRRARQDVVVVLSGEGSDELLAGYGGTDVFRRVFDRLDQLRHFLPLIKPALRMPLLPALLRRKLETIAGSDADYFAQRPQTITRVFDPEFQHLHALNGLRNQDPLHDLAAYYRSRQSWNGVDLYLGALIEWWLPDDLLHKADRMSMAHSLELRSPFLDAEFAALCAELSLDDKVQGRDEEAARKVLLKKAFAPLLPPGLALQPKKGFVLPVYQWLQTKYANHARVELERNDSLSATVFDLATRRNLLERAMQVGDKLSLYRVWSLMVLNKWGDRWL